MEEKEREISYLYIGTRIIYTLINTYKYIQTKEIDSTCTIIAAIISIGTIFND